MSLSEQTVKIFEKNGLISLHLAHFVSRPGQVEMARRVAFALETGRHLVVEAGTGVGKTFAYLVPAILSGKRCLVSTATKTLQDQLFLRDLPQVMKLLGLPLQVAMLKGRSSYLCQHRLPLAQAQMAGQKGHRTALDRVAQWARLTFTGDLAELKGLDEHSPLRPLITSTRENCLGAQCPSSKTCHVNMARKEALVADLVVVNHHLFFADLVVRESGVAQLLPSVDVVILDEAHHLNDTGVGFLSQSLASSQLLDLARDVLATGLQHAKGLMDWIAINQALEQCVRELRLVIGKPVEGKRIRWDKLIPEGLDVQTWTQALDLCAQGLQQAAAALTMVVELNPEFERLLERTLDVQVLLKHFQDAPLSPLAQQRSMSMRSTASKANRPSVRWVEQGSQWRLVEAPLDVAHALEGSLFAASAGSDQIADAAAHGQAESGQELKRATWIFTSATLGTGQDLSWFAKPLGLIAGDPDNHSDTDIDTQFDLDFPFDAQPLPVPKQISRQSVDFYTIPSPYDYRRQAALAVPAHLPKPTEPHHSDSVAQWVFDAVNRLSGRTMVLTTSLRALSIISQKLQALDWPHQTEVLVQGQSSKADLIERLLQAHAQNRAAVLIASVSFWEGIDVPGAALQCVIIDKLPFPSPGDPLQEARSKRIESQGGSAFQSYALPEATLALKQGAGRLIRRESDTGLLVVCDTRLTQMSYGRTILKFLPDMPVLTAQADCDAYLDHLAASRLLG